MLKELKEGKKKEKDQGQDEEAKPPAKEVVTSQIPGIEVMDLDDAVARLWRENIYAESGMGCTGPIVLISDANMEKAKEILEREGFIIK